MPKYFFDVYDGVQHFRDEEGGELPDRYAARKEALMVIPNIARDRSPLEGSRRDFIVDVRSETGKVFFTVTLSLAARWLQDQPEDLKASVEAKP
jgi:hypothetical protein